MSRGSAMHVIKELAEGREVTTSTMAGQATRPLISCPASSHIERLAELESIGCDQFAVYLMHDEDAAFDADGSEIIPALSR